MKNTQSALGSSKNKKLFVSAISVFMMFVAGCATTNSDYNASVVSTLVGQNDNIVATGYAVISIQDGDNPAHQRLLSIRASKLDAYRALLEQVYGQYLDTSTTVAEMVVQSDSFRARVQGVIYGAQLVSITTVGDDTYETTLSLSNSIVNDLRELYLESMAQQKLARI